jgi:hypothetical protein
MTHENGNVMILQVMDCCVACEEDGHVDMGLEALIELSGSKEVACAIGMSPTKVNWIFTDEKPKNVQSGKNENTDQPQQVQRVPQAQQAQQPNASVVPEKVVSVTSSLSSTTAPTETATSTVSLEAATTTTPAFIETLAPSVDGKCGNGIVNCENDMCCSVYGFCGYGDEYCNNDEGCQDSHGRCEL